MATWSFPNREGQWRQLNLNETGGELWSTRNIDLHTEPGKVKLARPLAEIDPTGVLQNSGVGNSYIAGFALEDDKFYFATDERLYDFLVGNSAINESEQFDGSFVPTSPTGDITTFDGHQVISEADELDGYDDEDSDPFVDDWWSARGATRFDDKPNNVYVSRIGTETLIVTDGDRVHSYTGSVRSGTGTTVIMDIGSIFTATCLCTTSTRIFIGSYTETGEEAFVFEWDGAATNYTRSYPVGAKAVLSMLTIGNVPFLITERGELKRFNNAGFTTVAQLPFTMKPDLLDGVETGLIQSTNTARPIHHKGMYYDKGVIYIFVNSDGATSGTLPIDERTHSGVWAYSLATGSLSHLASPGNEAVTGQSAPLIISDIPYRPGTNQEGGRIWVAGALSDGHVGLWREDLKPTSENHGYFVTSELQAESVKDIFDKVVVKALLGDDDKITVKYRSENDIDLPLVASISWTGTDTFTSTDDLSHLKDRFDGGWLDEVEGLIGQGAARLAHVTDISESGGTYTVTVDEEIGANGESATVRFDNWKKVEEMTSADGEVKSIGLNAVGTWCQIKVGMSGKNGIPEVRGLIVKSQNKEAL